ncbi:MAG: DUF4428 domain-containing protein [Lachnospiraceae bacterium]|nr:DUF4428 domain-containing protein [Lachnospiraceae bacterium]MBQ8970479.1 DUF4428 domain-containing protein [Lachnospiraceae bacterium]MBR2275500.1 DUF4428 domain-containing protein [Lachnospiraceae bacterium]
MGLFQRKECVLCGGKVGLLIRYKLVNGDYICGDCREKMPNYTKGIEDFTVDEVKDLISLKEENDRRFENEFVTSRRFDFDNKHPMMAVDDEHGEFAILKDKKPDIFKFDEILNFYVDLHTKLLSTEETKKTSAFMDVVKYMTSKDFGSRYPDLPRCGLGYKITGMYFQINLGKNPYHAEEIRLDMLPNWSNSTDQLEKAYRCANDMYQCIKEYKG